MSESLESLKVAMEKATQVEKEATLDRFDAEIAYAHAKAESVGVKIGSIVTTGSKRYRIKSILYCDYRKEEFKLVGKLVRKDGSEGVETHDIWQDWTLEPTGEE